MTVHTDSTTASQSLPPLTSGEGDLQRWGNNERKCNGQREDGRWGGEDVEGREGEEDERDEAGAKAEAGVPRDGEGWRSREGVAQCGRLAQKREGVNSEEQRRGHGNAKK